MTAIDNNIPLYKIRMEFFNNHFSMWEGEYDDLGRAERVAEGFVVGMFREQGMDALVFARLDQLVDCFFGKVLKGD